ncbi:PepSY domain-containing protein [Flavobacterium algicola]|uniref:PepSY domain-containing protein n=1 Tax=Flavobacterium algicola TaxID=556529 RepID=UPI001EFDEC07|nr:PepSY domain-containing protein [Flavobacterium algicola]MCG9792532.1 PepSY domain-containing protein [Flavobacterium algicola]
MTLSFWRYAHLVLALFSSLFLIIASVTGVILAVDAVQEKIPSYKVENFDTIRLNQVLPTLRTVYPEITELTVDHNQYVTLKGIDTEDRDINNYIDPRTGKIIGEPLKKSDFIQWTTALHRSLFLKESGRFVVGFVSFLLIFIAISGFAMVIKRQRGLRKFFSKVVKEYLAQYYHVVLGRLALLPILILALSGTYLTLEKFHFFIDPADAHENVKKELTTINDPTFKNILLADIQEIEFPFSDDPEEYYVIKLKDKEIEVEQFSGVVISEKEFPMTTLLSDLSLDLHTGRTSILWAIILGLASLNILYFIYSGFAMSLQRRATKIKNKYTANDSNFILLVGSENGSTLRFANEILKQLLADNKKVFLCQLNQYSQFPKATQMLIFASTHGLGDPPSNGTKFLDLLSSIKQEQKIGYSVVGFGSKAYPDFCGYATIIDDSLTGQDWSEQIIPMQTVNDKSAEEFISWVKLWSQKTGISLSTTPSLYNHVPKGLQKMMVLSRTIISELDQTFQITLRPTARTRFTSGDLLAIYPAGDTRERLYSIAKTEGNIQLVIKLHPSGLGSSYLYQLEPGSVMKARVLQNVNFHFPDKVNSVALISNGTGIAPFLGMMEQNSKKTDMHLYAGFRIKTQNTYYYEGVCLEMIEKQQLQNYQIAYSREENRCYVMDLIQKDALFFINLLQTGGVIMICGSLAMQQDVEAILDVICQAELGIPLSTYKSKGQILVDCY